MQNQTSNFKRRALHTVLLAAALLVQQAASAGLLGDTVHPFGQNSPSNAVFIDAFAIVGAGTEFDLCTVVGSRGECLLRLEIDFTDTDATTRTTNLSSGVFDLSPGMLTFGDLDGPGELTGFMFTQDQYMNNAVCTVHPHALTCTYGGRRIAPGVALQSVVRFSFSNVPAPTALSR